MPPHSVDTLEGTLSLSPLETTAAGTSSISSLEDLLSSGMRFLGDLSRKGWTYFAIHHLYRLFPALKQKAQERALRQAHLFHGNMIKTLNYHLLSGDRLDLVERVLREEFHLVDADAHNGVDAPTAMKVLVYETNGPDTGLYRVHLRRLPDNTALAKFQYFSLDRRTGKEKPLSDYNGDPMQAALRRVYEVTQPVKVTGADTGLLVNVPWMASIPKKNLPQPTPASEEPVDIVYAATYEEASRFRDSGYEAIGCSFGDRSIVGSLLRGDHDMDSDQELVSMKAAKSILDGRCGRASKFVVTGTPTPDTVYAILVLSRMIAADQIIADAITELSIDPVGSRTLDPYLRIAAFDMKLGISRPSVGGYVHAIHVGKEVFNPHISLNIDEEYRVLAYEEARIARARTEVQEVNNGVAFVVSDGNSRDVWHERAPIIVQYKPMQGVITLAGCSRESARRLKTESIFSLLGLYGFHEIYSLLDPSLGRGSGGKETIGGSPRCVAVAPEQAREVYRTLVEAMPSFRCAAPFLDLSQDYARQQPSSHLLLDELFS